MNPTNIVTVVTRQDGNHVNSIWWQAIQGKLVTESGSVRSDYRWTGLSKGTPHEVLRVCKPSTMIGFDDQCVWSDYPWPRSNGALAIRPALVNDRWYLIATRIRGCREQENAAGSRFYTQACYLITPLEDFCEASLVELPLKLRANAMGDTDFELATVKLSTSSDIRLEPDWIDSIQPYLEAILCGLAVGVEDRSIQPDEFFQTILICLSCLPATIRWRLPVGAGLYRSPDDCALGQAMHARGDVVKANGNWRGEAGIDLTAGTTYVEWLRRHAAGVRTVSALRDQVDRLFPDFRTWNALPPALDWRETVKALREVKTLQALDTWLAGGARSAPSLNGTTHVRVQALRQVLDVLRRKNRSIRAHQTLNEVADKTWKRDWEVVAGAGDPLARGIAMLLGHIHADPSFLAASEIEMPKELFSVIATKLSNAFERVSEHSKIGAWGALLAKSGERNAPGWLRYWVTSCHDTILWKAFEIDPTLDSVRTWKKAPPAAEAMLEILCQREPSYERLQELASTITDSRRQSALNLYQCANSYHLFAASLMLWGRICRVSGGSYSLPDWLHGNTLASATTEHRGALAQQVLAAARNCEFDDALVGPVLMVYPFLSSEDRSLVARRLEPRIDGDVSCVFLDERNGRPHNPALRPMALSILADAMTASNDVASRVFAMCRTGTAKDDFTREVGKWLSSRSEMPLGDHAMEGIRTLYRESYKVLPEFNSVEDARLAARVFSVVPPTTGCALETKIDTLGKLRACATTASIGDLHDPLPVTAALERVMLDDDERAFWKERLRHVSAWESVPKAQRIGWRLLRPHAGEEWLHPTEQSIVAALSDTGLIRFVCSGWPVPRSLLGRITPYALDRASVTIKDSRSLLQLAVRYDLREVSQSILFHILQKCREANQGQEASIALRQTFSRGVIFRAKRRESEVSGWAGMLVDAASIVQLSKKQRDGILDRLESREPIAENRFVRVERIS